MNNVLVPDDSCSQIKIKNAKKEIQRKQKRVFNRYLSLNLSQGRLELKLGALSLELKFQPEGLFKIQNSTKEN